jgi:multiple sugar transport system ATP-binding protein
MIAVTQAADAPALHAGSRARVWLPPSHCLLFNAEGRALSRRFV